MTLVGRWVTTAPDLSGHSPSSIPACSLPLPPLPLPAAFHLLSAGAWAERFTLHVATGELRTATVLRRSDRAEYIFTVTASDRGTVPRSTSAIIRIQVSNTPAALVPVPSTPCSSLGGHHSATWQPSSISFLPSTTFIQGHPLPLLNCCSSPTIVVENMGWEETSCHSFINALIRKVVSISISSKHFSSADWDSHPSPTHVVAETTLEVPCPEALILPSIY